MLVSSISTYTNQKTDGKENERPLRIRVPREILAFQIMACNRENQPRPSKSHVLLSHLRTARTDFLHGLILADARDLRIPRHVDVR